VTTEVDKIDVAVVESNTKPAYRWLILALAVLTAVLVVAAPTMALPVLFDEIAADLDLSLVQIGLIWGMLSFSGIFVGLIGGSLGDRFGTKLVLTLACVLVGISGALRGLSGNFMTLLATTLLVGLGQPVISINLHKLCAVWFPSRELGLANGAVSSGMALGFLVGSLVSATFLSPLLDGWRNVLYVYGGLALAASLLWGASRAPAAQSGGRRPLSPLAALPQVARLRNVWIMSLALLGFGAAVQGYLGYLPLYLRAIGWPSASADSALATFHGVSLCAAIPITLLSDRLNIRRGFLMLAALLTMAGIGLMSVAEGWLIWLAVGLAGLMRDGFMALFMTGVTELKGIGVALTGTALGFTLMVSMAGQVFSPPLGNSLAGISPALPFVFWAMLALLGFVALLFLETRPTPAPQAVASTEAALK
jgi:cyanate permease